ncbi:N-acetylmuramidase domain-containing protein [Pokkaliibacter sp. MBI-7]|uniref:N-acetylmuramidase domain-containing protein n=1 Tax=Pokkaliibacter sp. MBI-7 TaxID=3040600 RepID=UPI002446A370|nr:N-acetylmuramidase domain-containing protein [Pokkaliibacter sp. MBI-7]MDH2435828.1 N-acetylmuramidase domain-containing protein [Pokkaliibacter sp. MBI-7]
MTTATSPDNSGSAQAQAQPEPKPTQFKLPVVQDDGKDFKTVDEAQRKRATDPAGFYLFGLNNFWHGGIHLNSRSFPQHKDQMPLRCIADGEVIAYRVNEQYFRQPLLNDAGTTESGQLCTSLDFCLVRHDYLSPKRKDPEQAPATKASPPAAPAVIAVKSGESYLVNTQSDPLTIRRSLESSVFDQASNKGKLPRNSRVSVIDGVPRQGGNGMDYYQVRVESTPAGSTVVIGDDVYAPARYLLATRHVVTADSNGRIDPAGDDVIKVGKDSVVDLIAQVPVKATRNGKSYTYLPVRVTAAAAPANAQGRVAQVGDTLNIIEQNLRAEPLPAPPPVLHEDDLIEQQNAPASPAAEPQGEQNRLRFYSLYMHLAPYEDYKAWEQQHRLQGAIMEVTGNVRLRALQDGSGDPLILASMPIKTLPAGSRVRRTSGSQSAIISGKSGAQDFVRVTPLIQSADQSWHDDPQTGYVALSHVKDVAQPTQPMPLYWVEQREGITKGTRNIFDDAKAPVDWLKEGTRVRYQPASRCAHPNRGDLIRCTVLDENAFAGFNGRRSTQGQSFWMELLPGEIHNSVEDQGIAPPDHANPGAESQVHHCSPPIPIKAGDPVGYLSRYDVQTATATGQQINSVYWSHLELFSDADDSAINALLDNAAQVNVGKQYLKLLDDPQRPIYLAIKDPGSSGSQPKMLDTHQPVSFEQSVAGSSVPMLIEMSSGASVTDDQGKVWYPSAEPGKYISADAGEVINQYELRKLGYQTLIESNNSADGFYKQDANSDSDVVAPFFQQLFKAIDTDHDGEVSLSELQLAFQNRSLRDVINRIVPRHPSEWHQPTIEAIKEWVEKRRQHGEERGGWSDGVKALFKTEVERIEKLEFLSQVPEIKAEKGLWHFEPFELVKWLGRSRRCYCHEQGIVDSPCFEGRKDVTKNDFETLASELGIEREVLRAIAVAETGDKTPFAEYVKGQQHAKILYERHYMKRFLRKSGMKEETINELEINEPTIVHGYVRGYQYGSEQIQYERLIRARQLDEKSANMSCSWGKFQVMGEYYHHLYESTQELVDAQNYCAFQHLQYYKVFLTKEKNLVKPMKEKDWLTIAIKYNGANQVGYDGKIERAYNALKVQW